MTYISIDRDQEQRLEQDAAVEEIYISGIGDAMAGTLPQMAELTYLQGYAEGMREFRKRVRTEVLLPVINTEPKEFPLVCHQCAHLNNGICEIKGIVRNGNQYACSSISADCPF